MQKWLQNKDQIDLTDLLVILVFSSIPDVPDVPSLLFIHMPPYTTQEDDDMIQHCLTNIILKQTARQSMVSCPEFRLI